MTVLRQYRMLAKEGQGEGLLGALKALAASVRGIPGCEKVEIFADPEDPLTYVFIEHWPSVEAHKASAPFVDKEASRGVGEFAAGAPDMRYLVKVD